MDRNANSAAAASAAARGVVQNRATAKLGLDLHGFSSCCDQPQLRPPPASFASGPPRTCVLIFMTAPLSGLVNSAAAATAAARDDVGVAASANLGLDLHW